MTPFFFIKQRQLKQGVTLLFGYVILMALVLASYDTDGIFNGTILSVRSR